MMFRLEKAAAKLPKKDLPAVKKRFAFLEVILVHHAVESACTLISLRPAKLRCNQLTVICIHHCTMVLHLSETAANSVKLAVSWQHVKLSCTRHASCAYVQEDVRSIEAGVIPMPKYSNSQAAFYAVQQAPPPMPMPPPIPIETSATVST